MSKSDKAKLAEAYGLSKKATLGRGGIAVGLGALLVSLVCLSEMMYSTYAMKKEMVPLLEAKSDGRSYFTFKNTDFSSNVLTSRVSGVISRVDECDGVDEEVAAVSFKVSHLPFYPDKVQIEIEPTLTATPGISMGKGKQTPGTLKESAPSSLSEADVGKIVIFGDYVNPSEFNLMMVRPNVNLFDARNGASIELKNFSAAIVRKNEVMKFSSSLENAKFQMQNSKVFAGDNISVDVTFDSNAKEDSKSELKIGRLKSEEIFVRDLKLTNTIDYDEETLEQNSGLEVELVSFNGTPIEQLRATLSSQVGDYQTAKKIIALLQKTCGAKIVDEEQRVDLRLLTNHLIKGGVSASLESVTWGGPRGDFNATAKMNLNRFINEKSGLPDLHKGIEISGQMTADKLYSSLSPFSELADKGAVKKDTNGNLIVDFLYKKADLKVSGVDAVETSPLYGYKKSLNQMFTSIFPSLEVALLQ